MISNHWTQRVIWKRLLCVALLGSFSTHGAIKKAVEPPPTPKLEEAPAPGNSPELKGHELKDLVEELRRMRERNPAPKTDPPPGALELKDWLGFQTDRKLADQLAKNYRELLDGHRPGSAKTSPATVVFREENKSGEPIAFGTIINRHGWILTKASEVASVKDLRCRINGQWEAAKVVRQWEDHDLALIKVAADELPTVSWASTKAPEVGTFITAVAPEGSEPVAIGVVSVAARNLQSKGRGFLGVRVVIEENTLKVSELVPGAAAITAGVQKDDQLLEIDGQKPDTVFAFTRIVSERKAGETIKLRLRRGEEVLEKDIQLGDRALQGSVGSERFNQMNSMGSTISKRRDNFPSVIQTDLPLDANQCGGPVTDLDGNAIGLVIARSGRIESLVIPAETIQQTLADVDLTSEETAAAPPPAK